MYKDVLDIILQFSVLLDLIIVLVVVGQHSFHKPLKIILKFPQCAMDLLLSYAVVFVTCR